MEVLPQKQQRTEPLDLQRFARSVISASKRHLLISVLGTLALEAANYATGASILTMAILATIGTSLVLYNLLRIRRAARALESTTDAGEFVVAQRRSHRVRGKVYLVASPIVLVATGLGLVLERPRPPLGAWVAFLLVAAVLAYGWIWWRRALRQVEGWRTPEAPRAPA